MTYLITDKERQSGIIDPKTLNAIFRDIQQFGYAVVEDLVSTETCHSLTEAVLEDVEQITAAGQPTQHEKNTGPGHLQLGLRRYAPYVKMDLVANSLIESVVKRVLGQGAWLGFYNGNVNCPNSGYQPLHFDRPFSWRTPQDASRDGEGWPPPTTTLSCSVALQEITESNGATEIYPGTHHETKVIDFPVEDRNRINSHPELIEKWSPPSRMQIPAGGVCFRDPRMWHRGVPNTSVKARVMLAVTYHAAKCKHWRGLYIQDLKPDLNSRCAEDSTLRVMDNGQLGDGRLVFQSDVSGEFSGAQNLHGINRNIRFIQEPEYVNHFLDAHNVGGARVVSGNNISPAGI